MTDRKPQAAKRLYTQCVTTIPRQAFDKLNSSVMFQMSGITIEELQTEVPDKVFVKCRFRLNGGGDTDFKRRVITAITTAMLNN